MPTEAETSARARYDEMRPERVELRDRVLFCGPPGMSETAEDAILDVAAFAVRAAATPFRDDAMRMLHLTLISHIRGGDEDGWLETIGRILDVVEAMRVRRMNDEVARLKAKIAAEGPDATAD